MHRTCGRCAGPLDSDGPRCRSCEAELAIKREYQNQRYANDPDFREHMRQRTAARYAAKADDIREHNRQYREANRDRINARHADRMANDPEYRERRRNAHKRRNAKRRKNADA